MTRLELLKKEKAIVMGLKTLSYDCIDECIRHFDHEIECIEVYGSNNPECGLTDEMMEHYKKLAEHYNGGAHGSIQNPDDGD